MNTIKPQNSGKTPSVSQNGSAQQPHQKAPASTAKETAQEAVHQVMPKDAAKKLSKPVPATDAVPPPLVAAKGNDELMSQPQKAS